MRPTETPATRRDVTSRARRWYRTLAEVCLTTVLLFVTLNLVASGVSWLRGRPGHGGLVARYGIERVSRAYVGWDRPMLEAFLAEAARSRTLEYEPFTEYRARPYRGRFIRVDERGYREVADQGRWPPDRSALSLFFFGGSTAFGDRLPDADTIPSRLQERLAGSRPPVYVYNFGRPGHFSSQERILFEQLLVSGFVPARAIFLDGLNECYFVDPADGPYLWKAGETDTLRALVERQAARPLLEAVGDAIRALPVVRAGRRLAGAGERGQIAAEAAVDPDRCLRRWLDNHRAIRATAEAFRVPVLFVWQPVPTYGYDTRHHLFPEILPGPTLRLAYERMAERRAAGELGDILWLADMQRERRENLYVDSVHYSAAFARDIATAIAEELLRRGLVGSQVTRAASGSP